MRTARLARCSVPFAPGRRRGCGTSPRLTTRCDERGAMELEHIERILSRSTHPQCTGRRSRRLRALLMRSGSPPSAHPLSYRAQDSRSAFPPLRSVAISLGEKPSRARIWRHGLRLALWKGGRGRWCMRAFVEEAHGGRGSRCIAPPRVGCRG
ncbi:hypothetical protein B0H13DRAFT_2047978, partial [Mycena leptocephala]